MFGRMAAADDHAPGAGADGDDVAVLHPHDAERDRADGFGEEIPGLAAAAARRSSLQPAAR
jgi:hypothetical protein